MQSALSYLPDVFGAGDFRLKVGIAILGVVLTAIKVSAKSIGSIAFAATYKRYRSLISFEQAEVRAALAGYVRHECMFTDPSTRMELAEALTTQRFDLFKEMDSFVSDPSRGKFLFLFADCGMGKTTFLINYFHRRMRWFSRHGLRFHLVSLGRSGYDAEIAAIPMEDRSRTVLLMDAFDEDPLVLSGVENRLAVLVGISAQFNAVVITCRSQFFASDAEIPVATGALRTGPTPAGISKEYEFERIYLAPFDSKKIERYLRASFPGVLNLSKRRRARRLVDRLPTLAVRPMLLAHISDVLEVSSREGLMSLADIYQAIASAWVKREQPWLAPQILLNFSRRLAMDLFQQRVSRVVNFVVERN